MILDCDPQQNATAFLSQWQGVKRFDYDSDYRAMASNFRLQLLSGPTTEQKKQLAQYALRHCNLYDLLRLNPGDGGYFNDLATLPKLGYQITDQLSVMAAHPMLSAYEVSLGFEVSNRGFPPNYMARLGMLLKFLLRSYDLVLLDLSPSNSLFNQMALASSTYFVMPVTGDRFTMQSLETLDLMLSLMRHNFSQRLNHWTPSQPVKVPQLLCLLYSQYNPGESVLQMGIGTYCVSADDAKHCQEIVDTLHNQEKTLGAYMNVDQVTKQLVLLTRATDLHQKLGHAYYTVFDTLPKKLGPMLDTERLGQQQEYDILWEQLHAVLFSTRNEWL